MDAIRRQLVRQSHASAPPPFDAPLPLSIADHSGKEIQIKMLLDAMQNSFNFVLARNAHYAAQCNDWRGRGQMGKWHGKSKRNVCVCVHRGCGWGSSDRRQIKTFNRDANRGERVLLTALPWSFDWEIAVNYLTRIFNWKASVPVCVCVSVLVCVCVFAAYWLTFMLQLQPLNRTNAS